MDEPRTWPPLWAVPLLLLLAIDLAVRVSAFLGLFGLVPLAVFVWWIQTKADRYVRDRRGRVPAERKTRMLVN